MRIEVADSSIFPGALVSRQEVARSHMPSMFQRPAVARAFSTVRRRSASVSQEGKVPANDGSLGLLNLSKEQTLLGPCRPDTQGPIRSLVLACEVAGEA